MSKTFFFHQALKFGKNIEYICVDDTNRLVHIIGTQEMGGINAPAAGLGLTLTNGGFNIWEGDHNHTQFHSELDTSWSSLGYPSFESEPRDHNHLRAQTDVAFTPEALKTLLNDMLLTLGFNISQANIILPNIITNSRVQN